MMPVPQALERRYSLRRRAVELIGALEAVAADDVAGRDVLLAELVAVAQDAAGEAEEARRNGLDPMTLRVLSRHAPAGQTLLQIAPLGSFSYSALKTYGTCPLQYAFQRVYRIPGDETKGYFEFGTAVHSAFETFAIARRDARAAGAPDPGFEVLKSEFDKLWEPTHYDDAQQAEDYLARSEPALRRFYDRELASPSQAIAFEQEFEFALDAGEGADPVATSTVSTACRTAASRSSTTRRAAGSPRARSTQTTS
jgi:hypothetical protein